MKDIDDELENGTPSKDIDKLQYKQIVLIVLLTVIMVLSSLTLSFSAVRMISSSKNMNYNSIIVQVPGVPGEYTPIEPGESDFVFNYKEVENVGNGIYITNMSPTLDEVGKEFVGTNYTFEFKLYFGSKSLDRYYEITAEKVAVSNLDPKYVKIYLESDNEAVPTVLRENGKVKVFSEFDNATVNESNDNEKIIFSGNLNKKDIALGSKSFVLKMWLSEDAPINKETMDKTFVVRINVYAK